MTDTLLLSWQDLEKTLDFPSVLHALNEAFRAEGQSLWDTPKRIAAHTKGGGLLAMPCGGGEPEALGAKLVSTFAGNGVLGLPSVSGLYALFDPSTGVLLAVMDGAYLTLVRTAAVSALATRVMARSDASSMSLGVFGAGAQAEFHIRLLATVRPIRSVTVWARRPESAQALMVRLRDLAELRSIESWTVAKAPEQAAAQDIVVTATGSTTPVLEGRWLHEGCHVVAIGTHTRTAREIDTAAVTRAATLVVETADTLREAGDFQMVEDEAGGILTRVATLGRFIESSATTPRDVSSISIFKSCGVAFEDLAVATVAFRRARDLGLGSAFAFS